MDRITFKVNGKECSVGHEVDSDVSLNDYLRNWLNLRGTKYMCKEGGCGACIVTVCVPDRRGRRTFAVNSCLVSVTSCQDWEITTIEGIGDRRAGYHPVQRTLAEHNGTQCGYCSVGWVMNMYSLLESKDYDLTQHEIENSFGSNICRCTGYRPILDAFKTFAKDATSPNETDIEDLKHCSKEQCTKTCAKDWCFVEKSDFDNIKTIHLKDNRMWYRVTEMKQIFEILIKEGNDSYMLVNGNTGRGAVPIFSFPRVLIDISPIEELKAHFIDENLVVGAGMTLTDLMTLFKTISREREEFTYLQKFYEHLDLVAHIPVRNIGTIAGNLMVKHRQPTFSSDIFLLLESVGATMTIINETTSINIVPEEFLTIDMAGKVITQIKLPPLSRKCHFISFKIMPRSQNVHAQVNAAFLYEIDTQEKDSTVLSSRIVITGLSAHFVHARDTELFLRKKKIFTNEVLQQALNILEKELIVEHIPGELKPEYRKKCALGLFYKGLLSLIPDEKLKPRYRSGARDFRKTRPLSSGIEVYDTNPVTWPVTEPMPKVEALIQCAGEAKYVNDITTDQGEVFCAFVTSDICTGEIDNIDPTPALDLPGVLAFFSVKDIPGVNSFLSQKISIYPLPEEIFADGRVKYYDQAIGVIVAETEKLANRAAFLVRIKYKADEKKPILTISDVKERDPSRISVALVVPARDRGLDVQRVIKGSDNIFWQYHFSMETLSCVTRPSDDGIDVFPSSQWPDLTQVAISESLNIEQNRINLVVPRCGGSYGNKISRATQIATVCALVTYLLNRPCRFVLSIQGSLRIIGKRLPATRDFEVGFSNTGEIQYLTYNLYQDNGYVATEPVINYTATAVKNAYDSRRWQFKLFNVTTDTASNTYCRSPGALEAIAMTESIMEQISYELAMDPFEVRLANLNPEYTDVRDMIQTIIADSEYYKRKQQVDNFNKLNRWKKRGLGVAIMTWPVVNLPDYNVLLTVFHGDATVVVNHGGVDIGQGINTKVIQAIAYTLNISVDKVKVKATDVVATPNSFATGNSRTTQSVCFAAIKCCQLLLDRLSIVRESLGNPTWEVLIQDAHNRGINLQTSYKVNPNDVSTGNRSGGAVVTETELDILTGEHDIVRVDLIEDVGTSLNPELDIGQVEGAFVMGIGYWTHEHLIYDDKTGEILTDRTWYYHVPLAKDIPIDFRVQLRRNSYDPRETLGAKAVAEAPTCLAVSVAFALRAAIVSSREETGYPRTDWFHVDGPFTLEANVLKANTNLKEFLFY